MYIYYCCYYYYYICECFNSAMWFVNEPRDSYTKSRDTNKVLWALTVPAFFK